MALSIEAGELAEVFQWLTEEESRRLSEDDRRRATEEIADVLIYLLRLGDKLDVDLHKAIIEKLQQNEQKYPVDLSRGNAIKYSRRDEGRR